MIKSEFLEKLEKELKRNHISDASDIVSEYEQHFAFKMADGYSQEEIAAKLGNPVALASQFEASDVERSGGRKAITITGLCFADLFAGCFFVLLFAWEVIMAAVSLCCAAVAVCLFGGWNLYALIPPVPYWCGVVFGLFFGALAVLAAVGCVYFFAFLCQLARSYRRFHHNALAAASGSPVLPALAIHPHFSAKTRRRIRLVALVAVTLLAVCFVLGMIVSMLSAGALEFWHTWGWFAYTAA
jgi:uncharacterized membrane protein